MDRDRTKQLVEHTNKVNRQKKELELSKNLRKEVDINAGSSRYRIKEGPNKGKDIIMAKLGDPTDFSYSKQSNKSGRR